MSTNINSTIVNNNNIIGAKKLSDKNTGKYSEYIIEAPQSLYKYSINKVANEKDSYNENIRRTAIENLYPQKSAAKKTIAALIAAGCALILYALHKK